MLQFELSYEVRPQKVLVNTQGSRIRGWQDVTENKGIPGYYFKLFKDDGFPLPYPFLSNKPYHLALHSPAYW